jgi:DNA-binding NarL/FixJ family response regulator
MKTEARTHKQSSPTAAGSAGREKWRALIVDDHPLFRSGLRELLENEPGVEICGEAEHEDQAFRLFESTDADLVTVDLSLATGHGLSLVSRIKKQKPSAVVLVVSMHDNRVYAQRALTVGANGYVCKQANNQELLEAVRTVQSGEMYLSKLVSSELARQKPGDGHLDGENVSNLSGRELQIFTLIGQGRNTHQISNELKLAVSTVETYRERLKTKLNLASGAELTRHAILWVMQSS